MHETPVHLAVLKLSDKEAEERWGWKFESAGKDDEYYHATALRLESGDEYFFICYPHGSPETQQLSVSIHAEFDEAEAMLANLRTALELKDEDFVWINENLSALRWCIKARDKEGNSQVISVHYNQMEARAELAVRAAAMPGIQLWVSKRNAAENWITYEPV